MRDEIYEKALAKVNELRESHKIGAPLLEFPKGILVDAANCPIQKALKCQGVVGSIILWHIDDNDPKNDITERVAEEIGLFVAAFDLGGYPELIEK